MKFKKYSDRTVLSNLESKARKVFERHSLITEGNNKRICFTGVIVSGGEVYAVLPRNSDISCIGGCSSASLLLRVLSKYSTSSNQIIRDGDSSEDFSEGLGLLGSILWLLNDYTANGLYSVIGKKRQQNSGKINWNRTIAREVPVEGVDGCPVYSTLHTERVFYGDKSLITLIHASIIKELDISFGWVITGDPVIRLSSDLERTPSIDLDVEVKISLLQRELVSTYSDRNIKLINKLIDFLKSTLDGASGEFVIGVRNFQNVWEDMLRKVLPGVIEVNKKLPKPLIYYFDNKNPTTMRGMITDIVSKKGNSITIIDAKYYKAESGEDFPGWTDMVKQFFYAKALSFVFPENPIVNWFAFPGQAKYLDEGPIACVAMMDIEKNIPLLGEFPPIGCSYFRPIEVMSKYVSFKKFHLDEVDVLFRQSLIPNHSI